MKGKIKTKKYAVSYYDRHNPRMRSLNAHNTYISDWDPNTKLLYIVRDDYLINETIYCFSIDDNSVDDINNGVGTTNFKWLKYAFEMIKGVNVQGVKILMLLYLLFPPFRKLR